MWIGKFSIKHPCPILEASENTDVVSTGYVLNAFEENGEPFHSILNVLSGENIDQFVQEFEKHPTVIKTKLEGNLLVGTIKGEMIAQQFSSKLFYLSPVVHEQGREVWTLGSLQREELTKFYQRVQKLGNIKILQLKEVRNPTLIQTYTQLTDKQQSILKAAQEHGYYDNPRKVTVKELAQKLSLPRSTVQEHLRKAEGIVLQAVIPFMPSQ